ncbi:MAG: UDP-N-acetyl-D-glucosamine dehydrogenase, partial [Gemmatimonadetes bacterium]|nr:UDP-N-acetyl-D-glucosamine dehydrogenase [Gemmatimonadota bacterium]
MSIQDKLKDRSARLGVIGLGYVGLPLAVEYAESGFEVIGIDVSQEKVDQIMAGESYVGDVPTSRLEPLVKSGKLIATTDASRLADVDSVNICVPTPLSKTRDHDISYIDAAVKNIAETLHPGQLIILE